MDVNWKLTDWTAFSAGQDHTAQMCTQIMVCTDQKGKHNHATVALVVPKDHTFFYIFPNVLFFASTFSCSNGADAHIQIQVK